MVKKTIQSKNNSEKIEYIYLLRIISAIGIITLHVAALKWYDLGVKSYGWNILNFWNGISRAYVPIFVMISGALFLSKNYTTKGIYKKNILRIIIAFIFWSVIYAIVFDSKNGILHFCKAALLGHYHMWFLVMIVGLYMFVPFFKKIVENRKIMQYFLLIYFAFQILIPQLSVILYTTHTYEIANIINKIMEKFQFSLGYSGYFILGYYLSQTNFNKKNRRIIYILGIIGTILTVILSLIISHKLNNPTQTFYSYFSINVMLEAIGIFVFAKYNFKSNPRIENVSKKCFGIYLVHSLIFELFDLKLGLNAISFNPILSVPIIVTLTFILSLIITNILSRIPLLNKYVI